MMSIAFALLDALFPYELGAKLSFFRACLRRKSILYTN